MDGLAVASHGFPNCEALIGSAVAGSGMVSMATWSVTGVEPGAEVTPSLLPMPSSAGGQAGQGEAGQGGGGTPWMLDIDPTFEGNLWSPARGWATGRLTRVGR